MVEERKDKSAMKRRYIPLLMATGVCLGSCVGVQMVNLPDMPYKKPIQQTTLPPNTAPVPTATTPAAPGATNTAPIPAPRVTPPPTTPKPATKPTAPATKPATPTTPAQPKLPKPEQPKLPTPTVTPPTTPTVTPSAPTVTPPAPKVAPPAPTTTPTPTPPAPAKKITNEGGQIPVAVQVEGDPTRVINPLDPSRKLRIIDKNGNRVPSGKKMKVPGTDFIFIVP